MSTVSPKGSKDSRLGIDYNSLFKFTREGVVYQDASGSIIDANEAACEILGLSMDELLGRSSLNPQWRAIKEDGSSLSGVEHPAMIALKTGVIIENHIMGVYNPPKKSYRWISVNAVPEFHEGKPEPVQVFTTFRDITSEFLLNQQVVETKNQFIGFLNTLHEGVWYRDFESRELVFVNESTAKIFGISRDEFFEDGSYRYEDFIHPLDRKSVLDAYNEHFSTGKEVELSWRLVRADKQLRYVRFRLFKFSIPGFGDKAYSAGLMSDITEEYQLTIDRDIQKERAEEFNRIKSNLLNTISHEFRTPITGILGFAKLLQEPIDGEERVNYAKYIEKSTSKLYKTLESILDFASLDAIKVDLTPTLITVQECIRMILDRTSIQAHEKGLYFQEQFTGLERIYFYRNILDPIVKYVLDNAIKFTSEGGIRFLIDVDLELIRIQVHDTGTGIPQDALPYIFEPFRQGSEGVARLYDGVGMGLAIVKKILDSVNGEINLEINDHGGSSFNITIPLPDKPELEN